MVPGQLKRLWCCSGKSGNSGSRHDLKEKKEMADRDAAAAALARVWNVYRLINLGVPEDDAARDAGSLSPEAARCRRHGRRDTRGRRPQIPQAIGRPAGGGFTIAALSFREKLEPMASPRIADGIAKKPEEDILKKFLMIGALAFTAMTVAETAMAAEYYVVRDSTTKKCTVVETKPTSSTTVVVDNGVYKTKTEAETGMKTTKVCTE